MGMAVSGNYIYVANFNDDTVRVIDTTSGTVDGLPIAVGNQPYGVTFSPDGTLAYVANYGDNTVTVIDTATRTVVDINPATPGVDNIQVGSYPADVAVSPDGTVYVTNSGSNTVSVISFTQQP